MLSLSFNSGLTYVSALQLPNVRQMLLFEITLEIEVVPQEHDLALQRDSTVRFGASSPRV